MEHELEIITGKVSVDHVHMLISYVRVRISAKLFIFLEYFMLLLVIIQINT